MARMGDDYERRRGPVKQPLSTGGNGSPMTRVPTPTRTGGPLPRVSARPVPRVGGPLPPAKKKSMIAMNGLASLTGSAPKKKAKKRTGF